MKIYTFIYFAIVLNFAHFVSCQEWTWIGGNQEAGAASSPSGPGARSGSSVWQDSDIVWLFGGLGFSDIAQKEAVLLNDLWNYNIAKDKWTLVHPGTVSKFGNDKPESVPPPRHLAAACGMANLSFMIFGGLVDDDHAVGDTWVFNIGQKRWVHSSQSVNLTAEEHNSTVVSPQARGDMSAWCMPDRLYVFGGMGSSNVIFLDMWKLSLKNLEWSEVPSSKKAQSAKTNLPYPKGRNGGTTWVSTNNTLFLFGGNVMEANIRRQRLNIGYTSDLWLYYINNDTWHFVKGYRKNCHPGIYGRLDSGNAQNIPGCRRRAISWVDRNGNLWMFGGDGTDRSFPSVYHTSLLLSDVWFYSIGYDEWIWMSGSDKGEAEAKFLEKGKASMGALPGGRSDGTGWTRKKNQFSLFGGVGHDGRQHDGFLNDMWILDVTLMVEGIEGIAAGLLILMLLILLAVILAIVVIFLYARDRGNISIWSRLDRSGKYSHLESIE